MATPNLSAPPPAQAMAHGTEDWQQQSTERLTRTNGQQPAAANVSPEQRRGCRPVRQGRYLANDLPPLFELEEIFADMASKAQRLGFAPVLDALNGRPLRVATMCSGTEAPLLALEMIQSGLDGDHQLLISHIFSCEIVPLKQSYIERNFRPPLLFRDITELGGEKARTAYGSLEVIPGDIDILVAGTACVDFSPLNVNKKTLQQGGESGATFDGLLRYAERFRPRLIIQENVRTAPWGKMSEKWEKLGYTSILVPVDTKHYYIPQTRERGYLVVIDKRRLEAAGLIGDHMDGNNLLAVHEHIGGLAHEFQRRASSSVGMFLLDDDDRRLELIEDRAGLGSRSETSWDQYQVRHQRHRDERELGNERPITRSLPGINVLKAPDFYWHRYWQTQPERVWETVDMNFLKRVIQSYDMNFKEYVFNFASLSLQISGLILSFLTHRRWIDLSQGVDRGNDSLAASGIAGCLTPKGIPFVTTRGGPVSGTEALSLQGLPLDRMLLARETQAELMDMAGNAMTSTVVCAVMLASLIAVPSILHSDDESLPQPSVKEAKPLLIPSEAHSLVRTILQTAEARFVNHDDLKANAASTVLRCACERQTGVQYSIFQCVLCGHTACTSCHGNPTHAYSPISLPRTEPSEFIAHMTETIPMRLTIFGLSSLDFEPFEPLCPPDIPPGFWSDFIVCIDFALHDVFCFFEIKRGRRWRIAYRGTHSYLHLEIGPDSIQWLLFAEPPKSAPVRSVIREVLAKPIARMTPSQESFVDGDWEICSPLSQQFSIQICGKEQQVPSFEAECGLKVAEFVNSRVWTTLSVEGKAIDMAGLDYDICGLYYFLPDCGTALGAMYRKDATEVTPAIFLFLDPTKTGLPVDDACVFSLDHSRLPGYEVRVTIAELSPDWRSLDVSEEGAPVNAFYRRWIKRREAQLVCRDENIAYNALQQGTKVSIESNNCHSACITLASLSASAKTLNLPNTTSQWQSWDPEDSTRVLKRLAWLFPNIAAWSDFEEWNHITHSHIPTNDGDQSHGNCNVCNPPSPGIIWGRDNRGKITPYENAQEAAVYERAIKSRPSPFLVFSRMHGPINANEPKQAELRFTLNVQSLTHRASGKLSEVASYETITSKWRLLPNAYDMAKQPSSLFTLMDNTTDIASKQPPNFKQTLRHEQLRSLSWMISQESEQIEPFMEEEVEESVLPLLPWRAEVKATIPNTVRGGLLADEVGYGKTAIVLGLIDSQYETDSQIIHPDDGLIPTNATLIIVPSNVFKQWASEIQKFLGRKYKVLAVNSISKLTIQQVQDADIVLMSWSVLANDTYYTRLQRFTATPQAPARTGGGTGRNFDSWFHDARTSLREIIGILKNDGPEAMLQELEARRRQVQLTQANSTYVPSRRIRGQAFLDANSARDNSAVSGEDSSSLSDSGYEDLKKGKAKAKPPPDDRKEFNIKTTPRQNWRTVKGAFVHAFSFNRLVIDEYTYAGEERQTSLVSLHARSKWILSGTPNLNEFADIKSIARYLGLHLGVDDDGDCDKTQNLRLKTIRKNHTAAEAFQMYQAPRSNAWYKNRRLHAQHFLNRFARQNVAQIKHIELTTDTVTSGQTTTEKEAYDALFQALKDKKKRIEGPLNSILSKSQCAEEALIMACTTSQIGKPLWNIEKCLKGARNDGAKSAEIWDKVDSVCRQAAILWYRHSIDPKGWKDFQTSIPKDEIKDSITLQKLKSILADCFISYKEWTRSSHEKYLDSTDRLNTREEKIRKSEKPTAAAGTGRRSTSAQEAEEPQKRPAKRAKVAETTSDDDPEVTAALNKALATDCITLLKQVCEIDREQCFYEAMVDVLTAGITPCQGCTTDIPDIADLNILQTCGHILCTRCMLEANKNETCILEGCDVQVSPSKTVAGATLMDVNNAVESSKLDKLVEIIHGIPEDELALIFIQIDHLMPVASDALKSANIEHRMVTSASLKGLEEFIRVPKPKKGQTSPLPRPKALILNLGGAMAAGLNLQCANHIIFLSPLFTSTQHDWEAGMTQAIGRARRYGQQKTVHVYHLLVKNTYDVNIFQERHGGRLFERSGVPVLIPKGDIPLPGDLMLEGEMLPGDDFE
ncbi:hypothetical protein N7452_002002 [Penicillium brevicompactum]|uniref:Helicase ATP-binding domain-containing protein n=1 Tax=Penicillium brevicompactum TaxID=5074 RepID=A0A9W9R3J1_PENBR|nr:hypothetical protein N7452_002002 [Penicillium brevicompactum]